MSLNDNHMLPDQVRNMRQMKDVLTVEDLVLTEIEQMLDKMYDRASLLHEELINEEWLESRLAERTGAEVAVGADAENLLVDFVLNVSRVYAVNLKDVRQFINKWLPAHLMYKIAFLIENLWKIPEIFIMSEMLLGFEFPFWGCRTFDGSWLLDGSCRLDAIRKLDEAGFVCEIEDTKLQERFIAEAGTGTGICLKEAMSEDEMAMEVDCPFRELYQPQRQGLIYDYTVNFMKEIVWGVVLKKALWLLDGTYRLNGERKLDAERREEVLQ